jgi:hypothetical protein
VVWFRLETKKGFRGSKQTPIKKFKNGEPARGYFGGGMYSNYLSEPKKHPMRTYEIFPTLNRRQLSFRDIATDSSRSFELCKRSDNDHVQLAIRSTIDDIEAYAKSLGVEYNDTNLPMLPIISKNALEKNPLCFFFDFELEHQLNFTAVDTSQEPIINKLIRAMNIKNCAILIQFLFTSAIKWNDLLQ